MDGQTTFTGNDQAQTSVENHFNVDYFQAQIIRCTVLSAPSGYNKGLFWGLMGCLVDASVSPACPAQETEQEPSCTVVETDLVAQADVSQLSASSVAPNSDIESSKFGTSNYGGGWRPANRDGNNPWLQVNKIRTVYFLIRMHVPYLLV